MKGTKKKIVSLLVILAVLATTVLGAWVIHLKGATITGQVTSDKTGTVMIENQFNHLGLIDTTNSSYSTNETAEIKNNNGDIDFIITFNETRMDVDDDCYDYENDVNISYEYDGETVETNDIITIPSGKTYLTAYFDVVRSSCPHNISVSFELAEI